VHRIRVSGTGARVAADANHADVERFGELREAPAALSEADASRLGRRSSAR
jgi:hypothetical protein